MAQNINAKIENADAFFVVGQQFEH
jgi:hypothetical protein